MPTGSEENIDEQTRPDGAAPTAAPPTLSVQPFRIGPYTVLGSVGHGAMGIVYAAYDEKLDRKVALKLLHSLQETGTSGQARLLREAQALARVSHPNVVQVYEVGEHDREVYIVMEFVRGDTLRGWNRARARGWREVLAVYLQAGHGLAAAHAAGVMHRDFKPDNVMVGDDARVRVMDFGLARAIERPEAPEPAAPPGQDTEISQTLTAAGAVLGTPAYMAPEQYMGGEVGAHSDQFAYCVALFEALYGQRPFVADNLRSHMAEVARGKIREPPPRAVPRWLRQIVTRGLAADPAQRWPSMQALLTRIERGQALARLRALGVLLAVVALTTAGAWAWYQADLARREAACVAAGADIDAVWNEAARAQVREAFMATGQSDAAETAERVLPWLDRQAEAWRLTRAEACIDAELRGLASPDTLDRTLWCLDERRMDLEALVTELSQADQAALQKAVPAAMGLEPAATCRDAASLARLPAPPAEGRELARALRAELARSSNLLAADKLEAASAAAQAALSRAQAFAWPPLTTAAQLQVGVILEQQGKYTEAEVALEDAGFAAMEAGVLGVAADATIALVMIVGHKLVRFEEGLRWSRLAELVTRALEPEPGLRTTRNLTARAVLRSRMGQLAEARALQEQALALQEQALGTEHIQVAVTLNNLSITHLQQASFPAALAINARALAIYEAALGAGHYSVTRTLSTRVIILRNMGEYPEALTLAQRVLAATERHLGPTHPDVALVLTNLANLHFLMGTVTEVQALHERALAIREQAFGPAHPEVAATLSNLGIVHQSKGELALARALHTRALAIREQVLGPDHREVAISLSNLAAVELYLDEHDAARPHLTRALEIFERAQGPDHPDTIGPRTNLGELELEAGKLDAANLHYTRVAAILEAAAGPNHPSLVPALSGQARVALAARRPADAVPLAERAAAIVALQGPSAPDLPDVQMLLARVLWEAPIGAGRDRKRALEQAHAAREAFQRLEGAERNLAEVERWLAKHRG